MSLTLYQGTDTETEATLAPLLSEISTRNDAQGATITIVYRGTPAQITAYRASGLAGGYSDIDQTAQAGVEVLTVTYRLGVGETVGSTAHLTNHLSVNWRIQPHQRQIPWAEHPMIAAENHVTTSTKMSYKYVSLEQRIILAKLMQGGLRLGWGDKWNKDEDKYDSTADTIETHFTNAQDAADTTDISLGVLQQVYERFLSSGNPYFTVHDHEVSRQISFNLNYTGAAAGVDPSKVLRQKGAWSTSITAFDSFDTGPAPGSVISFTLTDIQKDNAYPDLGFNGTPTGSNIERGFKKFLKTGSG